MDKRAMSSEVSQKISDTAKTYIHKLCDMWEDLGFDEDAIKERFVTVETHIKALFDEMVREETVLQDKLKKKIDSLMQLLDTINIDLDMSASCNIENLALRPAREKLEECLSSLRTKHSEMAAERQQLEKQEHALCKQLCEEPLPRPERRALAADAISALHEHIHTLQAKKEKLVAWLLKTRAAIIKLYADLEKKPPTKFEQAVVHDDADTFDLSLKSIDTIKDLQSRLENDVAQVQSEVQKLRERLSQLWERLEVDAVEKETFFDNFPGYSRRTRKALNDEILRCEELKHQNMGRFIVRMREELEELWSKCYISEEEQAAFSPFYDQTFSDELLDTHEKEVQRLESYYATNRPIFDLLTRRSELWERMAQAEAQANDKSRLFQNRGGQLLKEEKERKQLQKELPQVEAQLKKMIHSWEESSGEPFLLHGRRASVLLDEQWENRKMNKERVKQERKVAQQRQLHHDAVMGTTMMSGQKRKRAAGATPSATPEVGLKRTRVAPSSTKAPASKVTGVLTTRNTSLRSTGQRRLATTAQRRLATATRQHRVGTRGQTRVDINIPLSINVMGTNQTNNINDSLASSISYSDFTHHLETRATRSSAANPATIQLKTARSVMSPISTPANSNKSHVVIKCPQSAPAKPPRNVHTTPKVATPSFSVPRHMARTAPKLTRTRNNLPIIF